MFAAIPYFALGVYDLELPGIGNVPLDPWALLVCVGFVVGMEIARHRAIKLGLDVRDVVDGSVFIVLMGFLVGHVVTVLGYYPERLTEQGIWALLKVWEGFSSIGGFIGAVFGAMLFFLVIRPRPFWRYADLITFGFPFGWFLGRVGCGIVHDHVGRRIVDTETLPLPIQWVSNALAPLAMDFDRGFSGTGDPAGWANGIRHELGLLEALYMLGVMAIFLALGRKDRVPGFFIGLFAVLYAPVRFVLDFLRNEDLSSQDARYLGLTPAQYGVLLMLLGGAAILATRDWKGFRPWPMDGRPDQASRAEGGAVATEGAEGG